MQSKKEHTGEDADYGAAPGKHQFVFLSKASLNYHSKKMRDSHLQLEKKKWVLKITSYAFMLGSKQVVESKLRCCLTEIHFLHWYCSEFLINYSKII